MYMTQPIPNFANEEEEQAFWDTHDSTEYLDWGTAERVIFKLAQNKKQAVLAFLENEIGRKCQRMFWASR